MILCEDEEGQQLPPYSLHESLDSPVGSKSALTPTWAHSVRRMLVPTEVSSSSPCSSNASPLLSSSSDSDHGQEQHHQLDTGIANLEGELVVLRTALGVSKSHRRAALNRMLDLKGNIRVFCRVRPFLQSEKNARTGPLTTPGVDLVKTARKDFQFDRVFQPSSVQDDIFAEVEPIIRSALDGHNVCIFAYGQTGTGKTFTMEGSSNDPGVVPRTLQRLFDEASLDTSVSYSYSVSMLEVYKGSLRDLLVLRPTRHNDVAKCLSIQMGSTGYIEVENLTEIPIANVKVASRLYSIGSRRRSTAWTNANDTSSRSHCLLRINITCTSDNKRHASKLWLIDLGGSERLLKTNAQGLTLEEGKAMNVSLSALGDVISALQKRRPHVPYRNSKLTQILRDSLGEDSKTLMLVHVSPKEADLGETICSLSFATRARGTHLGREIFQAAEREKVAAMAELYRQMNIYETECQFLRGSIKSVESLIIERRAMLPQEMSISPEQPACTTISIKPPPAAFTPCEKYETETTSPPRSVPRFMSPTASSRGKKSPGVPEPSEQQGKTQQPPMTFSAGHSKRIAGSRSVDMKMENRSDLRASNINPKRKLEKAPWPASLKKSSGWTDKHSTPNMKVESEKAPCNVTTSSESPLEAYQVLEKFMDVSKDVSSPVYQTVSRDTRLRILTLERSECKVSTSASATRGQPSRSRRRLSLECGPKPRSALCSERRGSAAWFFDSWIKPC